MSNGAQLIAKGLPLFQGLDPQDLDRLDLTWTEQSFKSGNTVFAQDNEDKDVMFLLSGALLAV